MKKIFTTTILFAMLAAIGYTPTNAALVTPKSESVPTTTNITKQEAIKNALAEFKSLSKRERKLRLKEAKAALKQYKAAKKTGNTTDADTNTILLVILAILLPPLAVYLKQNAADSKFLLDLLLWLVAVIGFFAVPVLGWLCGLAAFVYALIVILG